eukprot:379206-Hanusia_phi.AAC.1
MELTDEHTKRLLDQRGERSCVQLSVLYMAAGDEESDEVKEMRDPRKRMVQLESALRLSNEENLRLRGEVGEIATRLPHLLTALLSLSFECFAITRMTAELHDKQAEAKVLPFLSPLASEQDQQSLQEGQQSKKQTDINECDHNRLEMRISELEVTRAHPSNGQGVDENLQFENERLKEQLRWKEIFH